MSDFNFSDNRISSITKDSIQNLIREIEEKEEEKLLLRIYKKISFSYEHPFLNKIFKHNLSDREREFLSRIKEDKHGKKENRTREQE